MTKMEAEHKPYFVLTEHNRIQVVIFVFITVFSIISIFYVLFSIAEFSAEEYSNKKNTKKNLVIYNNGAPVPYSIEDKSDKNRKETNKLYNWAVDLYVGTPSETRYWFNPILSVFMPVCIFGILISVILTSLLPQKLGLMKQKIEREISNTIDKIQYAKFGYYNEKEQRELIQQLINSDIRDLHDLTEEYKMNLEDLKVLYKALKWRTEKLRYKFFHINDGIRMYMRFYFTVQYSNGILGLVYIGAAVLIIIIGLRGIKFIPPTQPSLVLFALGLEFTMLIVYAFTLMYSRPEDETELESSVKKSESVSLSDDLGSSKEVEKLLRVFIKTSKKKT